MGPGGESRVEKGSLSSSLELVAKFVVGCNGCRCCCASASLFHVRVLVPSFNSLHRQLEAAVLPPPSPSDGVLVNEAQYDVPVGCS